MRLSMRVHRELKTTSVAQLFFLAVTRLVFCSFGLKVWLSRTGVSTTINYTTSKDSTVVVAAVRKSTDRHNLVRAPKTASNTTAVDR